MSRIKQILYPFVLILFFCTNLNAQSYYVEGDNTFYGGPVLGFNFTQVDGDNYAGYNKVGLNIGGIVYTKFGSDFAASMEISYTQKGSRGKPKPSGVPGIILTDY